jgi:putative nucleotidyltransferase with HDIG domain
LLRQDIRLTNDYIAQLKRRGVPSVYISGGELDDITIGEMISDEVLLQAHNTLSNVFDFVHEISTDVVSTSSNSIVSAVQSKTVSNALRDHKSFNQLNKSVSSILNELIETETIAGISQLRSHNDTLFSHSINVTTTALMIGKRLHLNHEDLIRLGAGCMLHDIGKIFLGGDLLNPQQGHWLSHEQHLLLREHARIGYELLRARNPDAVMVNHVAFEHHERQDGLGYPRGLHGTNTIRRSRTASQNILLISEIAAVADVHDILSIRRPGYPGLTPAQIADSIRQFGGTLLNREVVQIFLSIFPVLPIGINIVIRTGRYTGYKGVVTQTNAEQPDRPVIRLIFTPQGRRIVPIDLDLSIEESITVEAILTL